MPAPESDIIFPKIVPRAKIPTKMPQYTTNTSFIGSHYFVKFSPDMIAKNKLATVKLINACHFHHDTPKITIAIASNVTINKYISISHSPYFIKKRENPLLYVIIHYIMLHFCIVVAFAIFNYFANFIVRITHAF